MAESWLAPTAVPSPGSPGCPLDDAQVTSWRDTGVALVDGLLPAALIQQARTDAEAFYPKPGSTEAASIRDFGSGDTFVFPSASDAVNHITLHPRLLEAVAQLLGTAVPDLRLTQSDLWAKYGRDRSPVDRFDNDDQRIHVDYPNHMLTHPSAWDRPEAVEIIIYFGDVREAGGATAVVPRTGDDDPAYPWPIIGTPGVNDLRWINDRASAEAYLADHAPDIAAWRQDVLYPREVRTSYRPGSVLFYRHDVWHRGTPLEPSAMRIVQNLSFRHRDAEWISTLHPGWSWAMYRAGQKMEHIIGSSGADQRSVLGFPAPGSPYWTPETLAAVTARYLHFGFDPAPYAEALNTSG